MEQIYNENNKKGGREMNVIDRASVIRGTEAKAFTVALNEMREMYSEETARIFKETYAHSSLSFITERLYDIVKEAYYGTDFITHLIQTAIIPPYDYECFTNEIKDLIENAKMNMVPESQIMKYQNILNMVENRKTQLAGIIKLENKISPGKGNRYIDLFFDILYDIEQNGTKEELKNFLEELGEMKDPYLFYTISPLILSKYPEYSANEINMKTREFYQPYKESLEPEEVSNILRSITAMKFVQEDAYVESALENCGNVNLRNTWHRIMMDNISRIDKARTKGEPFKESVQPYDAGDAINRIFSESDITMFDAEYNAKKYHNLEHRMAILEHVIERHDLFEEFALTDEQYTYYQEELANTEGEMAVLEWEESGEPNAVLKKQIMTKKEKEKETSNKEESNDKKEEKPSKDSSDDDIPKIITKENKAARKKITTQISKELPQVVEGVRPHYSKKELEKFINGETNDLCLGVFGKEKYNETFKAIREIVDGISFKVSKDNYWTIFLKVSKNSEYYIEADENFGPIKVSKSSIFYCEADEDDEDDNEDENTSSDDVQKPKEDFLTRVQNKAMDRNAARKEKKAERAEKRMKLRNAAKAETEEPRGWFKDAKKFTDDVNKMDENRRKEFFTKPGHRHHIFRNFRVALEYYGVSRINIFMTPYLMVLRHFSKEKDKRLRNELVKELDTEIKICEEKINDANGKGDNDEKYKLMRIKDKLIAERTRVQINSKYI